MKILSILNKNAASKTEIAAMLGHKSVAGNIKKYLVNYLIKILLSIQYHKHQVVKIRSI